MQIDVAFGDALPDAEQDVELPTILAFPAPRLTGYSRETAIAEKLNAMFQHGRLNSRMKDYFDIPPQQFRPRVAPARTCSPLASRTWHARRKRTANRLGEVGLQENPTRPRPSAARPTSRRGDASK